MESLQAMQAMEDSQCGKVSRLVGELNEVFVILKGAEFFFL
jgi:hypothetical protein